MNKLPRETWVEEWSEPEPELYFEEGLYKTNSHTRRAPYRLLPKGKTLGVDPEAFNAVLQVYPDAISIGTVRGAFAGNASETKWWGGMTGVMLVFFLVMTFVVIALGAWFLTFVSLAMAYMFLCTFFYVTRDYRDQPQDDPVLFNRTTRMVHVLPYIPGGFLRFWVKGGHGPVRSYRWDDQIHGRIYRYAHASGTRMMRVAHELGLLATSADDPRKVEVLVTLGVQSGMDHTQLSLWEHIRQYMDEGGPPLQPGDALRKRDPSRLPPFPQPIIAEAGGPPLDAAGIRQQVEAARG